MPVLTLNDTPEGAEERGKARASGSPRLNRDALREELDVILAKCVLAPQMEPDQAMILMSGLLARLVQLHIEIARVEHVQRDLKSVRTQEVDYAMDLVRDQYRIASRLISVRALDVELLR